MEDLANEEDEDQLGELKKLAGAAQMVCVRVCVCVCVCGVHMHDSAYL